MNDQKDVISREIIVLDLNIKYSHPLREVKVKIILNGLKSIILYRSCTIKHGWLDKLRLKRW